MRKQRFLALFFSALLVASAYVKADTGGIFFSTSFTHSIFNDREIPVMPFFTLTELNTLRLGIGWEWLLAPGNLSLGLDAGYSSGSRFGGSGGVDFIPFNLTAAFTFPLSNFLYIGPVFRFGGFVMNNPEWSRAIPMGGGRLEAELRSANFPFGLYAAGGFDAFFPRDIDPSMLPALEVGLRFPRGRLQRREVQQGNDEPIQAAIPILEAQAEEQVVPAIEAPFPVVQVQPPPAIVAPQPIQPPVVVTVAPPPALPPPTAAQMLPPTHTPLPLRSAADIIADGIPQPLYFEADTTVLAANSRLIVANAGQQLVANPALRVIVRAFAGPIHTGDNRYLISVDRARFVRDYLISNYGIAPARIILEAYSAEQVLERELRGWHTGWSAELVIIDG